MPTFKSLYCDQFTLSIQLRKPNYVVILPTDAEPQLNHVSLALHNIVAVIYQKDVML